MPRPSLPADPVAAARAKSEQMRDAERANPEALRPWTVDGTTYRLDAAAQVDALGRLVVTVSAARQGKPVPVDNPLVFVNPPLLVPDPAGDITVLDDKGVVVRRLRHDPLGALRRIIADTVR